MNTDVPTTTKHGLVNAEQLLEILWPEPGSRPCLRWLRKQQKQRSISYLKVGALVFFDPEKVKLEIEKRFTINAA